MSSTLWLPAAATSSARFTFSCPSTSLKSGMTVSSREGTHSGSSSSVVSPFSPAASCATVWMGYTAGPRASVASGAFSAGTNSACIPSRLAASAMGSTPEMGRMVPSRLSSPRKALVDFGRRTLPLAARILNKIGRS